VNAPPDENTWPGDPAGDSPGQVVASFLAADYRSAIMAAPVRRLRDAGEAIARYLCRHLASDPGDLPSCGAPGSRPQRAACATGSGMRAGFELLQAVTAAVCGAWLAQMGFDPEPARRHRAYEADIVMPAVAGAGKDQLREMLTRLTDSISRTAAESAGTCRLATGTEIPEDISQEAASVTMAISLYNQVVLTTAANVLYRLRDNLVPDPDPALPLARPAPGRPISLN
jgi:hypothetical protein